MKTRTKIAIMVLGVVVVCVVVVVVAGGFVSKVSAVGAGRVAKLLCSNVFVSGRTPEDVLGEDLADMGSYVRTDVDYEARQVTASLGPTTRRAVYREGLGCTVVIPTDGAAAGKAIMAAEASSSAPQPDILWPEGTLVSLDELPAAVDGDKLAAALDRAFAETDPERPRKTRAVVVVYKGRIIAERVAPGFGPDMPMISWSMAKSVTNALVGILVAQGKLTLDEPAPVPEWRDPGDPRGAITLDQLLRMSSGLEFEETYGDRGILAGATSDVSVMLFDTRDMAAFAATKRLADEPGSVWHYSSGTSNILSRIVRDAVGGTDQDALEFPARALFDRLGMRSAVFEPDASGTIVGSSFVYASPRDWARLGLLYLQDGVWQGERVLPEGWVAYTTTPAPKAPQGRYGAQWWLNAGNTADTTDREWPDLPTGIFWASGHDGQFVVVIPSHDLVLVQLGFTPDPEAWDLGAFIGDVLEAIPADGG
ncbi:serine hydrolase domain-containing protein [Chloroflexota bacterium]